MSATAENTAPRTRKANAAATNGDGANTAPTGNVVTLEIAGLEVTLPVKFAPGHVLTENQAKVLDAAFQRQFTNNQNALAKSRAEAFAKATTDAEKAAKAPLTAAQLAELYADYEPAVGGTPRQSTMEKLRAEAGWRAWVALANEHNDNVAKGGEPVIAKAGNKPVTVGFKAVRDAAGKVVSTAQEQKDMFVTRLLEMPAYADRVQAQLDAILAERGTRQPAAPADAVVASGADLL